jgi:hypothetical protein
MDVYFWQCTRHVNSIIVVIEAFAVQPWGILFIWVKWKTVGTFPSRLTLIPWIGRNVGQKFRSHRACIFSLILHYVFDILHNSRWTCHGLWAESTHTWLNHSFQSQKWRVWLLDECFFRITRSILDLSDRCFDFTVSMTVTVIGSGHSFDGFNDCYSHW